MIRSVIAFGVRAVGCLYVSYWALFFGIVAFLIITSYLQEHKHHPVGKAASHEASVATRKKFLGETKRNPPKVKIGQLVVLVDDVDGVKAGREGCIMGVRDDMVTVGCQSRRPLAPGPSAHLAGSASGALPPFDAREGRVDHRRFPKP